MHHLRLLILLLIVNFMTVAWADTTAKLRGPKEFDAPVVTRLGPLSSRDTLWRLAEQARPDPRLNMYQVMYAIYQKNPDAFLDDNFNHLKPGAYLEIPSLREILAVNAVEAQRKSENDDRLWAEKIRLAAQAKPEDKTAKADDLAKATREITEELSRVEAQQTERLSDLRERLGASMTNVETIVQENTQLKNQLDTVVKELTVVKSQLDKDSEIQLQLQQLLQQQAELLAQQREQIRKAEEGFNFAEFWQKFAASPVGWAIMGSLPAVILLLVIVSVIRRRGQKAAAVVSAATAAPAVDPNYRSPLPPLDDSLDFDESSLINLDDSLLNQRMQSDIRLDDDNQPARSSKAAVSFPDDDLLDDFSPTPTANTKTDFDLDDLLDEPFDTPASSTAKTEFDPNNILSGDDLNSLFASAEDEPSFSAKTEFDPNNILSNNDLDSLFETPVASSADEDPDAIFASALAAQQAADVMDEDLLPDTPLSADALQSAAAQADEFDELLEEIELDIPADKDSSNDNIDLDEDFDIDALVAQSQQQQAAAPSQFVAAEPVAPIAAAPTSEPAADADDFDIDALLSANSAVSSKAEAEVPQFDSSELDAFAESLAEERLPDESNLQQSSKADEEEPITELFEADESELFNELDDIMTEVAQIRAQSQQAAALTELELPSAALEQAQQDFDEAELSVSDISQMLQEADESAFDIEPALSGVSELVEEPVQAEEVLPAAEPESDDTFNADDILLDEELAGETAADLQQAGAFAAAQNMPDLEELDDDSVSKLYDAISSVERPSKVLDEYPELALEDELAIDADIFPDDVLLAEPQRTDIELTEPQLLSQAEHSADNVLLSELSELEDTNFDEMLQALDELQPDLLLTDDESVPDKIDGLTEPETQATESVDTLQPPAHDLPDYVHIDKLLAATEDDIEAEMAPGLNIDVGLADFEDLIAADEMGDVDQADAGFAGQLDLIRAYNEIGDTDSAQQLIKEILASDAPAHVKQEAIHLQNS
ncbi:FimV/HubP family polar landmark protein [Rheinheimera sp.]|uniref:FimV/HubP family polar landmark protein n=1 Tax=Rheinheimera sp. TaxID=1869214 RepID=UPI0025E1CBA1|nr:FimV/HubP family polar landmark protein [Rheinheimera sp.]